MLIREGAGPRYAAGVNRIPLRSVLAMARHWSNWND